MGGGLVVYYGSVGATGGYGGETQFAIAGLLGAQGGELFVGRDFGNLVAGGLLLVEPAQKLYHGHTVAQHGLAKAFGLGLSLDGAPALEGRTEGGLLPWVGTQRHGGLRGVEACGVGGHPGCRGLVGLHGYPTLVQLGVGLGGEGAGVAKEGEAARGGLVAQVAHKHGVVGHIGPAQIEQPCQVSQVGKEAGVGHAALAEVLAQAFELLLHGGPGIGGGLHHDGLCRHGGTVGPQSVEGVGQCHIFQSVGGQCGHVSQRQHVGRCAHAGDALCLEPLGQGGRVGVALAHQCKGCAVELCGGLQPIA